MAHRFTVIFEKEDEGGYHVFCPTLPGCHTQSETIEEGDRNIREAIQLYVDTLIEDGVAGARRRHPHQSLTYFPAISPKPLSSAARAMSTSPLEMLRGGDMRATLP